MIPRQTKEAAQLLADQIENEQDIKRVFVYFKNALYDQANTLSNAHPVPNEDVRDDCVDAINFVIGKLEIFIDSTLK